MLNTFFRFDKRLCRVLCGCLLISALMSGCGSSATNQPVYTDTNMAADSTTFTTEAITEPTADYARYAAPVRYLLAGGLIAEEDVRISQDSQGTLTLLTVSLGEILERGGITELSSARGESTPVSRYADWYLYTVGDTCSLFYMRTGTEASGMGVSFIELNFDTVRACLDKGEAPDTLKDHLTEVTTASAAGRHTPVLTDYFRDSLSGGAYLMADTFVQAVGARGAEGIVSAPTHYATCPMDDQEFVRVTEARHYLSGLYPDLILWEGDHPMGIRVADGEALSTLEKQAILTLYTMDVTFCSFAAEVAVHAMMCELNYMGSYDRCKIADMAVGLYSNTAGALARWENEFGFYNLSSTAVKSQEEQHPNYKGEYAPSDPAN